PWKNRFQFVRGFQTNWSPSTNIGRFFFMPNVSEHQTNANRTTVDYEKVVESGQFKQFMQNKRKFIIPFTIFFLIFYFLLPVFTSYTTFLNITVIGDIFCVWLCAFVQFIMTWVLCTIYVKKANAFDEQVERIIEDQIDDGDGGKASWVQRLTFYFSQL